MAKKETPIPPHHRGQAVKKARDKRKHSNEDIFGKKIPGVSYFNPDEWHCFPFGLESFKRGKYNR